jgi:enterochelin esterase-like enzyme
MSALTAAADPSTAGPPQVREVRTGMIQIVRIPAPSAGGQRTVRIYTPPSYDTPEAAKRRYPVVYLLHGWPGSDGNLFQLAKAAVSADTLIAEGKMPGTILVCPNGSGPGLLGRSLWVNGADTTRRLEDFVVKDLVGWVDANYRTVDSASCRGIAGISDGGLAAVNLTFHHPDVFGACAAHSADFVIEQTFSTGGIIGNGPEAKRIVEENSPALYVERDQWAERVRGHVIYIDCGTADESIEGSRRFHEQLTTLGIAHEYHEYPGSHTWGYWRAHLKQSLVAITAHMRCGG